MVGFELSIPQPETAASFYKDVFGWDVGDPSHGYAPVSTEKENGIYGGISKGGGDFPHRVRIHMEVYSIDETLAEAEKSGALVVKGKMESEDFSLAYLVDPTGIEFGLIERKERSS
nr:VOC family protein [Halobacillus sp. Cin3]